MKLINYLKITLRNLKQNKGFAFINIIGLGIGMAASILISLWVFDELSYDRFHEKADRIYRLERQIFQNGESRIVPITAPIYADKIIKEYPQVENIVRLQKKTCSIINEENLIFTEKIFFADNSFFDLFSIPLLKGKLESVLKDPQTLILSQAGAEKYFGQEDPLDKIMSIEISGKKMNFMVKGVMEDIPENSHFHFDVLASFSSLSANRNSWNDNSLYTYLLLKEGVQKEGFEKKLQVLVSTYVNPAFSFFGKQNAEFEIRLVLREITKIHFNNDSSWAIEPNRNKSLIYLFSFFSLIILLMASFNYVNLSTAIAGKRSLEVGIRKAVGAEKKQLVFQFISESMILSIMALGISFFFIEITLPYFNIFTSKSLSLTNLFHKENALFVFLVVFITGILSGIYPALYLSSIQPIAILKGKGWHSLRKVNLREVLVVLQFSISIALIIGAITANMQLSYFQNKPLGFDRNNVMIIPIKNSFIKSHIDVFRNDLIQQKNIKNISTSSSIPTINGFSDNRYSIDTYPGEEFVFWFYSIDENFFHTYGINLIAGSNFSKSKTSIIDHQCIISESVLPFLGFDSPQDAIGKHINHYGYNKETKEKIIGVVSDYHIYGLDQKIKPMVHYFNKNAGTYMSVKFENERTDVVLIMIENLWKKHFPNNQFSSSFLEKRYDNLYVNEHKSQQLLIAFTLLAIFIACLGLFGLVAYIVQQKTKEIGIRKVHGASNMVIVNLLNGMFIKWVLIANIISWPIAYYLLDDWLANFYYRINLPLWVFVLSGCIGLVVVIITVSYQFFRAARLNPADVLRYE